MASINHGHGQAMEFLLGPGVHPSPQGMYYSRVTPIDELAEVELDPQDVNGPGTLSPISRRALRSHEDRPHWCARCHKAQRPERRTSREKQQAPFTYVDKARVSHTFGQMNRLI